MPRKKSNYTPAEWDTAFNEAMAFCEENVTSVIARQMARDMLEIKELKAEISKNLAGAGPDPYQ